MSTAAYMRDYRKKNAGAYKRHKAQVKAMKAADRRLARMFPEEYAVIYDEERVAVGLKPVGEAPKGRPRR